MYVRACVLARQGHGYQARSIFFQLLSLLGTHIHIRIHTDTYSWRFGEAMRAGWESVYHARLTCLRHDSFICMHSYIMETSGHEGYGLLKISSFQYRFTISLAWGWLADSSSLCRKALVAVALLVSRASMMDVRLGGGKNWKHGNSIIYTKIKLWLCFGLEQC